MDNLKLAEIVVIEPTQLELVPETNKSVLELSPEAMNRVAAMTKQDIRSFIAEAEAFMKQYGEPVEIPVKHHFSKSVYAREMNVPKGIMLVGKIHRHQNLNILSKGEVTVLSTDGLVKVQAPFTFVASPGTKRLIYCHEDVVWTTIHGTDETEIEKIENEFIATDYEDNQLELVKTELLESKES